MIEDYILHYLYKRVPFSCTLRTNLASSVHSTLSRVFIKHSARKVPASWRILGVNIHKNLHVNGLFEVDSLSTFLVQSFLPDIPDRWFADAELTLELPPLASFPHARPWSEFTATCKITNAIVVTNIKIIATY